jgi:hypothetical protein
MTPAVPVTSQTMRTMRTPEVKVRVVLRTRSMRLPAIARVP